jgi:allantoinase
MTGAARKDTARRAPGMDHDRYAWSSVFERPPIRWPGDARVALWLMPLIEWFPLDMPLNIVAGGMTRPYPDYWNYTLRDYGNRVGIYRILKALDERKLPASVAFNAAAARRQPFLLDQVLRRGWEVVAMGVDMGKLHHAGVDEATEAAWVTESVATLRRLSGQPVSGWVSPGLRESFRTPDLVAQAGIEYLCDWANDDLPYSFSVEGAGPGRSIVAMPHGHEISDMKLLLEYAHSPQAYVEQVCEYYDYLHAEAGDHGGRLLSLPLHPWLIGTPQRIGALERILDHILQRGSAWPATGAQVLECWHSQQEPAT